MMDIYAAANTMKTERKTIFDLDIRVTFYARVSTTREEQENSVENQIMFFTDMIQKNPHWRYVEGYVDRVRGESAENRASFMRMIEDGKAGVFDLVLTKEGQSRCHCLLILQTRRHSSDAPWPFGQASRSCLRQQRLCNPCR
ncbi:MAG: recombinase family protein [Paludibacteraceae bacterium]|nr:recombinase family protein [Paludibacteraceae bacterium]